MKLTVFRNQYGFSTLAKNGEDKMYLQVQFKKGQEPKSDKARIEVEDGFFSMYRNKTEDAVLKLVIMQYKEMDEFSNVSNFETNVPNFQASYEDDDLPF